MSLTKTNISFFIYFIFSVTYFSSCSEDKVIIQANSLINIVNELPSFNCKEGGKKIETGIDNNNNQLLDSSEIINTEYICNGSNQIFDTEIIPSGEGCEYGGTRVFIGYDVNLNNQLEPLEITSTKYICNGKDGDKGISKIIETLSEHPGDNCISGGHKIILGYDSNNNGILENSEIGSTEYICNAIDGTHGKDGTNGENGFNNLIQINEELPGDNCENGGYVITSGLDLNRNNILDNTEVDSTKYICNSQNPTIKYNDIITKYDIEMIGTYGQSLALGSNASSNLNNFQNTPTFKLGSNVSIHDFENALDKQNFWGVEFTYLNDNDNERYPPATASLTSILSLLEKENNISNLQDYGYQLFPFTGGKGGSPIHLINKGTKPYGNYLECINKANEFANNHGKTFAVRVINWVQGESNRFSSKENYKSNLVQLFEDFNNDIKSITMQTDDIKFITYQVSPWLGRGTLTNMDISEAHVEVATENTNVYNCGAMYQFSYSDFYHPVDNAVVGLQQGIACKRLIHDEMEWITFKPISHRILKSDNNYFIRLTFDVPVKPMRFDISADEWHNPNGKQTNFGFEVLDENKNELQVSEPFIVQGNIIVLSTGTTNPKNSIVRYAVNGHDGGGNLCDSQNIIVKNKGINYVIDNFAIAFSNYLID